MNNSKIVSTKTTSAIFLAIVLVTGTIAALSSFSSSFMTNAQATSDREKNHDNDDDRKSYKKDRDRDRESDDKSRDYDDDDRKSYGKDKGYEVIIDNRIDNIFGKPYENDNNYYELQYQSSSSYKSNDDYKPKEYSSYGKPYYQSDYKSAYPSYGKKDNNNNDYYYKSTKDSSKNIDIKKINCNNINLNINNGGQVANNGNTNNGDSTKEDNTKGNKTNNNDIKKFNKNYGFEFVCVNNNDNRQITPTPPPTPPSPINNNVYVVWTDNSAGNNEIFFAVSNNNGQTFSAPKNISKTLENSEFPQITSEGDNVYVVWQEGPFGNRDIFFTASIDGGQTFSTPPENLSDSGEDSENPQISIEGDNVYVVWQEGSSGDREIFFAGSNDNGQTFSTPPDNLSDNEEDSIDPQISSTGNNVYVVWRDFSISNNDIIISFASSDDNGQNFSTPPDNLSGDGRSFDPQISSEGDNVYVVWATHIESDGHEDIFFTVSNNNGQTFDTPENISENPEQSGLPQISTEGNNVYVVWQDENEGGDVFIFFVVSNDNGGNFSTPPDNLSENIRISERPQISSEGDNVHVVWQGLLPGNLEIFFAGSNDNGENFSTPPDNLSDNDGTSAGPQISTEGDNVYVVWTDNSAGNNEIFFAVSNNNGQTFSTPPDNLSENDGESVNPQISSSSIS